jgi:maltose alpha-D-glucosyltransferase / alpha-amylase
MANFAVGKEMYPELRRLLPPQLPEFLKKQRWFGGKARQVYSAEITDVISISRSSVDYLLLVAKVQYADGTEESYAMPLSFADEERSTKQMLSCSLRIGSSGEGGEARVLTDALTNEDFLRGLLEMIEQKTTTKGDKGELTALQTTAYADLRPTSPDALHPRPIAAEQSNTSVLYGDRLILKFFRRLEEGINPDLEIGAFLTERAHFPHVPQLAGSLEYRSRDGRHMVQGILQAFVPNQGDAWRYTLNVLDDFYHVALKHAPEQQSQGRALARAFSTEAELPAFAAESLVGYFAAAQLLGRRTAEMHLALASEPNDPAFRPEQFTLEFQQLLEESVLELTTRVFGLLREKTAALPDSVRAKAVELASREEQVRGRVRSSLSSPLAATRTRIHGDYHLGQVLYTGSDFVIIDFEGEPARPLADRRTKRSPLQDVSGMLRSFHYAAFAPLLAPVGVTPLPVEEGPRLTIWAESWNAWVADRFLTGYFDTSGAASYLPDSREAIQKLLDFHLLEKAIYELGYELNNRPSWVGIPLQGIRRLLST